MFSNILSQIILGLLLLAALAGALHSIRLVDPVPIDYNKPEAQYGQPTREIGCRGQLLGLNITSVKGSPKYAAGAKAQFRHVYPFPRSFPQIPIHKLKGLRTDVGKISRVVMSSNESMISNKGSHQISLSYDRGTTWKVIHSYLGTNLNNGSDTNYELIIPQEAPQMSGVLWAWCVILPHLPPLHPLWLI